MRRSVLWQGLRASRQFAGPSAARNAKSTPCALLNASRSTGSAIPSWPAWYSSSTGLANSKNDSSHAFDNSEIFYPEIEAEVGAVAPDFSAPAVVDNEIKNVSLADYEGKYIIFFWYPKDFTFVCPTEIIAFSDRAKEFEALNCQLIAASTDTPESHLAWIRTSRRKGGLGHVQIPIVADVTKSIAARYGVLKRDAGVALRGLYIINPEGVIQHITMNDFPIGRNVDEALRTLQAIQFVAEHGEVCPAGWKPGEKSMVADPDKSLDYFSTLDEGVPDDSETGYNVVKSETDFKNAIKTGKTVVKFWAPWCGKCKMLGPYVDELKEDAKGVSFVSFDTSAEMLEELGASLGVKALPHFRFYKDGKEVLDQISGYKKMPLKNAVNELQNL